MSILIVGLSGSGKTTAASYLLSVGIPVVRMGDVTDDMRTQGTAKDEAQEKRIRESLRKTYGPTVYAQRSLPKVLSLLKDMEIVGIEGVRSKEEIAFFQSHLPAVQLWFIDASDDVRCARLQKRAHRKLTAEEVQERDRWEKKELRMESLRSVCDVVIENNGEKEEFLKNIASSLSLLKRG